MLSGKKILSALLSAALLLPAASALAEDDAFAAEIGQIVHRNGV
jgi:hypothetical protein